MHKRIKHILYFLLLNISFIQYAVAQVCAVDKGLNLINDATPPLAEIHIILANCDRIAPNDVRVLLLHGLVARRESMASHNFQSAITWLNKAYQQSSGNNTSPALELALTYEWAGNLNEAKSLYASVRLINSSSAPALLGLARIATAQHDPSQAIELYQTVLRNNPVNEEALAGLQQIKDATASDHSQVQSSGFYCQANEGLRLINNPNPSMEKLKNILVRCDQQLPDNASVLLLHGLYARKEAETTDDYQTAITWLLKAQHKATFGDLSATLALAVTYEWAGQFANAGTIYSQLLVINPHLRPALLGKARVAIAQHKWDEALAIYQTFLTANANDVDALNGLAQLHLAQNDSQAAKTGYAKTLLIDQNNQEALAGLAQINQGMHSTPAALENAVTPANQDSRFCQANAGLALVNTANPSIPLIKKILKKCDQQLQNNTKVLLLHGLLARAEGKSTGQYHAAIAWLKKADAAAPWGDVAAKLELAITYEWAKQFTAANAIYAPLLAAEPDLRPALLGTARTAVNLNHHADAQKIYQQLLEKDPKDGEALNGMGRLYLSKKQYALAIEQFNRALKINPHDVDALLGLKQIASVKTAKNIAAAQSDPCGANEGLTLLNQPNPPLSKIHAILAKCDQLNPPDVQALLLHGLLARNEALHTQDFQPAITWLQRAKAIAAVNNDSPALELAITYEWAGQPEMAQQIYTAILAKNPDSNAATFGMARTYRQQYQFKQAAAIYQRLLAKNPQNTDALNGLAWINFSNKNFATAKIYFNQALRLKPDDKDAKNGLELANTTPRYIMSFVGGTYNVSGVSSDIANINLYVDINATDQIIVQLTHNSKEIQLSLVLDPTLLPKNSVFLGFQRQYPGRYGWGVNYEYRERSKFRVEHRVGGNVNFFLLNNLQWLMGARAGFPSPWNNELYYSNLTLYTKWPVNFGVTGYWGVQQQGGGSSAYALDLSKEFFNRAYYDVGTSFSPSQQNWEIHGRFIYPVFKTQAIEGTYEHYYFNGASIMTLGWRIYF